MNLNYLYDQKNHPSANQNGRKTNLQVIQR